MTYFRMTNHTWQPRLLSFSLAWLLLISSWLMPSSSYSQTGLKIQLVAETTAIVPGQSFRVGLFIQHEKGWHTYWRQPGIVGVPTTISWSLPEGFKAGPLEYPEPEATMMFQIKAQGYERDVLLQTEITAPATLKPGQTIPLKGKASWMCCGTTCHPGFIDLSLDLPVASMSEPDARWHPIFAKERAAYARSSQAWSAQAEEHGLKVTLRLKPASPQAKPLPASSSSPGIIFFTEDGWINSDEPQESRVEADGTLVMTLTRAEVFFGKSTPTKLHGILQREGGWLADGTLRSLIISPDLRR